MSARSTLRERLLSRRALSGLLQTHPNTAFAEVAGMCGYDFLLLDGEHGLFSELDYLHTLRAIAATNALALVRLRTHDTQRVGRYLDMGVDAIVAPNVATVEQAERLARSMVYPPQGTRGFSAPLHRATRYGLDLAAHLQSPRDSAALLVIIESTKGVANVADILAVDGVDGAIIGPSDLTADLGRVGDFSQPAYLEAVAAVERAAAAHGKLVGTAPHHGLPVDALIERGHRLLIVGADMTLIREAMSAQLASVHAHLGAHLSIDNPRPRDRSAEDT